MTSTAAARTSHDQQQETIGDASRYPAQVRSITWRLLAGGYLDLARCPGIHLASGPMLAAVEDAFFTAAAEALFTEAGRIARDRAAQHPGTSSQRGET